MNLVSSRPLLFALLLSFTATGAACSAGDSGDPEGTSETSEAALSARQILELGNIAPGETKTVDYTPSPTYRALSFVAKKGQKVDFWVRGAGGDPVVYILRPNRASLAQNDDADPTTSDAHVTATIPSDGTYFVAMKDLKRRSLKLTVTFTGPELPPPPDPSNDENAETLSTYGQHTCGIRANGSIVCWGSWEGPLGPPPAGEFRSVSVGRWDACGVRSDGSVACWGSNGMGQSTPPAGTFRAVSVLSSFACGLRTDGTITCWGAVRDGEQPGPGYVAGPPTGTFRTLFGTCGVRTDDSLACWGLNQVGQASPPAGAFRSVSGREGPRCAVKTDGYLACWGGGDPLSNHLHPANGDMTYRSLGPLRSVSVESQQACAVRVDDSLVCWGLGYNSGALKPPQGTFRSVSMGVGHACAVSTQGPVVCWSYGGSSPPPPTGNFL